MAEKLVGTLWEILSRLSRYTPLPSCMSEKASPLERSLRYYLASRYGAVHIHCGQKRIDTRLFVSGNA